MFDNNRSLKSFTLIELLVVIAIIGILLSILLPSLKKTREKGMGSVCLSNQKQIGIALVSYSVGNNADYPYGDYNEHSKNTPTQQLLWQDIGQSVSSFICPLDPSPENYGWFSFNNRPNFDNENSRNSYMFNEFIINDGFWYTIHGRGLKVYDVANPAKWPTASDGVVLPSSKIWNRVAPGRTAWMPIDWWHVNNRVGMLFGDGHVSQVNAVSAQTEYDPSPES